MTGEINKDFYCVMGTDDCCFEYGSENYRRCGISCPHKKHKHPTPEQFKAEYGYEVPADFPVWSRTKRTDGTWSDWQVSDYNSFAKCTMYGVQTVCACTPWGKPPKEYE